MNREDVAMDVTVQNVEILRGRLGQAEALLLTALHEMCNTNAPRNSFTDTVDAIDAFLYPQQGYQVKHPEQAEGAQWEREVIRRLIDGIDNDGCFKDLAEYNSAMDAARAALAQPFLAPELERPEVVGRRCTPSAEMAAVQAYRKEPWVDDRITEQPSLPGFYSVEPLMTVAQHERIVESLQAEVLSWRETVRFNESCWAEERGVMIDKIQTIRGGIPLAIAAIEDGAVMITGIEDRLFKALSEHTHWKRKTASLELYAAPVAQAGQVPDGWSLSVDQLPKSGAPVLAFYRNSHGMGRRIRAEYIPRWTVTAEGDDPNPDTECVEYSEQEDAYYILEGWYELIDNWDDYSRIAVSEGVVTHWMPLAAAPAQGGV